MFIGHYGAGLAGKKPGDKISLGTLFMAVQWLDLVWPIFVLLNIEIVKINPGDTKMTPLNFEFYPFSHSLLYAFFWSVLFGAVYFLIKSNVKNSIILSLLVLSHWFLDFIVHRPDLPLLTDGPYEGLGLWNYPAVAIILESLIFVIGIYFYISTTKPKDKVGVFAFWGLIIFLFVIYIINLVSSPPPDAKAISYAGLLLWIPVIWAFWADRHRVSKTK
jgi:hypothetical protein